MSELVGERARLRALHEYQLLDRPAGDELEAVVRVAAAVAGVPTATLNLIDENRQCQLTTTGFTGGDSPRSDSMCAVHFLDGDFVWVRDAREHPMFAANPWVTGLLADVRFYASAPLVTPQGHALGSLCVFDAEPRDLTPAQIDRLQDLAQVILALFERRRQARINGELLVSAEAQHHALERAHTELAATNAELRRSNTELEHFAGVVSHDLAAPLAVVGGYLELLGDEYGTVLDPQAHQWITAAARAVTRSQALIDSLLQYARAGSSPCRRTEADLSEVADQALMDLRDVIGSAGAAVTVAPDLPHLAGDPVLLRQLLQNLVGNAVKYRRPDVPARVRVAGQRRGGDWLITVADNGIGIAGPDRERVFEMFTQVDTATAGFGVGLSTCRRIVERHGGRIWAEATPGGGTTVAFTLPEA
ncbi:sensor histidine kinase [Actinoplanes sp. RD1]|uniref:sensor histidine kinase n=1 Tax=Actinoplanes sp. RD1 TaxID=3064538 RepID=UPI0027417B74|nr:ATP-binding protein [Actinoplanes sp. RD1]